jgi:DNA-binding protein HU-beta
MTEAQLIDAIKDKFAGDITKTAIGQVLDALAAVATETLARGERVPLPGLGKLEVQQRAARMGRNPKTGAPLEIAASNTVKLNLAQALKGAVNG